jgi:hypothetical protein
MPNTMSSSSWHRLLVRADDPSLVTAALVTTLTERGYQRFDPFPGGGGTPLGLKEVLRCFVSPTVDGWVRVFGTLTLIPPPALPLPYLHAWIEGDESAWEAWEGGQRSPAGLTPYLKPHLTAEDLTRALERPILASTDSPVDSASPGSPATLPGGLEQLACERGVSQAQANRMISKLTGQLFGKLDKQSGGEASAMKSQAQALANRALSGPDQVEWRGVAGLRLLRIADLLVLPAGWREPDGEALRAAYQVARRLARNARAELLPDERAALDAVPGAIQYQAVYAGK